MRKFYPFFLCHFSCDLILSNWNKLCLISCSIIARQPQATETQHSVSIKQFSVVQEREVYMCIYTHTHTHTHIYVYICIYIRNRNEWAWTKLNITIIWSLLRGKKEYRQNSYTLVYGRSTAQYFLSHSSWPWCPTNLQFPRKKSIITSITWKPRLQVPNPQSDKNSQRSRLFHWNPICLNILNPVHLY